MKGCGVVNEKAWYLCLVTVLTVFKPRSIPKHKFAVLNPGPYPGNQNTNLPEESQRFVTDPIWALPVQNSNWSSHFGEIALESVRVVPDFVRPGSKSFYLWLYNCLLNNQYARGRWVPSNKGVGTDALHWSPLEIKIVRESFESFARQQVFRPPWPKKLRNADAIAKIYTPIP